MTGKGKHTTYKNGEDWGMVYGIVLLTLYIYTFNPVVFWLSMSTMILNIYNLYVYIAAPSTPRDVNPHLVTYAITSALVCVGGMYG